MARGFESKDIEFQQAEASRPKSTAPERTTAQRAADAHVQTLTLALKQARTELSSATKAAHRRMLEQAIAALEQQIRSVG
jgi:hypothetical protein